MARDQTTPLTETMKAVRGSLAMTALFSLAINLLMLGGPLYMLQVYDRVLPSGSLDTLIALSILLAGLFVVYGLLEFVRTRILARVGAEVEAGVREAVFDATIRKRIAVPWDRGDRSLAELGALRDFLSGTALVSFFDMPWAPVYLGVLALLHPTLGLLGLFGAVLLLIVAVLNDATTRGPVAAAAAAERRGAALSLAGERNAEALASMGMTASFRGRWARVLQAAAAAKDTASDRAGLLTVISKTARLMLQSGMLGLGAALVIWGEITAGAMIAATIILGRALAPFEQAIGHWRAFAAAVTSYGRLSALLGDHPAPEQRLAHNGAHRRLDVQRVFAGPPGTRRLTVSGLSLGLEAGEALGVIGPSGSGKSTLARLLAGVWSAQAGEIRLDGVALPHWNQDDLGRQLGYLPQDVELFEGTVAENIARFQADTEDARIIAAAEAAGVHDAILKLPDGYDTDIGESGRRLSGGQRQRIALARALFGDPFLVVLDEPNANLDAEGDLALTAAIRGIKARGGVAIVIAHRPSAIEAVDKVLVLDKGRQRAFGARDEVLARTARPVRLAAASAAQ